MKYKISDIAEINKKNINKNYKGKVFYLDTSSVTNDFFNCPKIYTSLKEAPIRARRLAEDGDTIISTVRPAMRHVGYISQNLNRVYSTGFAIISPKKSKVNPFYLYLVLSSKEITNLLQSIAVGSTSAYPSIKPRDIGNLIFDFPSLCIQEKIASIMQQIILKIKMNNQINDNLLDIAQNIYHRILFSSQITKTNLRSFATVIMGQSPSSKTYNENKIGIPLLNGAADFRNGIHPSKWTTDPKIIVNKGAYIFGVRATIGLTTKVSKPYAIGRGTGSAIPKDVNNEEILYFILNDMFKKFEQTESGSVYINISKNDFQNYTFNIPDKIGLLFFHEKVKPIMDRIYINKKENKILQAIKAVLLDKYFD